jgi:hypothetical protein
MVEREPPDSVEEIRQADTGEKVHRRVRS